MGLFHSRSDQPNQKALQEQQLQNQLRQAAAVYDGVVTAALQRLTHWAFPGGQIDRVDEATAGYAWQLWHTRADGSQFVDVLVQVYFEERRPDRAQAFLIKSKTPGGRSTATQQALQPEDLDYGLRVCVTSH